MAMPSTSDGALIAWCYVSVTTFYSKFILNLLTAFFPIHDILPRLSILDLIFMCLPTAQLRLILSTSLRHGRDSNPLR